MTPITETSPPSAQRQVRSSASGFWLLYLLLEIVMRCVQMHTVCPPMQLHASIGVHEISAYQSRVKATEEAGKLQSM